MRSQRFIAFLACVTLMCLAAGVAAAPPGDQPVRVQPFDPGDAPVQTTPPTPLRAPSGAATTYNVPGDFATIQDAIDGAISGDVIIVAAGTYPEAILIDAKNLTIQGAGAGSSIITGTGATTQYIVRITNAAVVDLSGFTIDGTGIDRQYGIYADAGSDGDIHDNEVKNVSWPGAAGIAIRRQECYIDVTDNDVYGFGRIGIYTRDDIILNTDTGVISGNTVTGLAGTDLDRLSYGISVYSGNPTIDGNDIYDCISGANVAAYASAGLDPWTGGTPIVSNNNFYNCDYGILSNSASPVMSGNTFTGTVYDDVRLDYFVKGNPSPHWAEYYDTIQEGIDAIPTASGYPVIVWIGIYGGGGTYAEAVHVDESCQIWGHSRATVMLDPAGLSYNNAGVYIDADDVLLSGFTMQSNGANPPRYGVKFADKDGCYLDDCEISGLYRTGVDILGATNLSITNVESHDNGGNGMQMVDATNVTLEDITTYNNSWGGVGIFTWGQYTPIGTSGIVFDGTNSFGETSQPDVGSIYLEEGNYATPASPYPISWSTNIGDGADVTLQLADVTHMLSGNSDNDNNYQRFYATLGDAQAAAVVAVSHILDGRYYMDIAGTDLWVPGNPSYLGSIQAAVDAASAGDLVHVAAGTFTEQVVIDKDLTVQGAGATTIVECPASLTEKFTTSADNYPVVYIHDADDVEVRDLVVDGQGNGNANVRFSGVAFRNAGGGLYDCEVKDIRDTPFSGSQHGVAIYAYNSDGVARHIDVHGCNVHDFQKNAMALNSDATTVLTVDVDGNTVTGYGATTVTAQNGIQVWSEPGSGTVSNNVITDIAYDNTSNPTKYVASSILNYYADVDVIGNTVGGVAHVGIYNIDGAGQLNGNTIDIQKIGVYAFGIIATDPPNAVPAPYIEDGAAPEAVSGPQRATAALLNVDISGNEVTFTGVDNTATYGIEADAGWGPDDIAVTANYNTVTGFEIGMEWYACESGCDTGVFTSIVANYNDLAGNTGYGMRSNVSSLVADGLNNWWGDATGPYDGSDDTGSGGFYNPLGLGIEVSDYIMYDPWMTGPSVLSVSPVDGVTNCGTPITFAVRIDHAGVAPEVRGFDVDLTIPTALVSIASPTFAGDFAEGGVLSPIGPTYFAAVDLGGGTYKVSGAILGGSTGSTLSGDLFYVTLTPTGAEGIGNVDLANLLLRDPNNVPLAGSVTGGTVQVDCTAPTMEPIAEAENECYNSAPTFANFGFDDDSNLDYAEYDIDSGTPVSIFSGIDAAMWDDDGWALGGFAGLSEGSHTVTFYVYDDAGNVNSPVTTWTFIKDTTAPDPPTDFVALPGHNKTHLSWTNPVGDASFVGVEIRMVGWTDYPEYGTPGAAAPSYPANETEGALVTQTAAETFDDNPRTPRDIYYYAAFSYDCAGNYSALGATAKDRTTSYWLGDIRPTPAWDGNVNITDLAAFSAAFGTGDGDAGWDNEADFGPTDDFSRFGIPLPDNAIQFEDLMIFAMNYGNVGPAGVSRRLATAPSVLQDQVNVRLVHKGTVGDVSTYALVLDNGSEVLKGVSVTVDLGVGGELVAARAAGNGRRSDVFFGTVPGEHGQVDLCAAALGVDVPLRVTGEIAEIDVRHTVESAGVTMAGGELRDLDNRGTTVSGTKPGGTPFVPTVSAVFQNHPNPFNPITTITFDVATPGVVTIRIFDVSGRLVRTVTDGHRTQGRHHEVWDGLDNRGNAVHSGIYFYRMTAPGYKSPTKKMLLLK